MKLGELIDQASITDVLGCSPAAAWLADRPVRWEHSLNTVKKEPAESRQSSAGSSRRILMNRQIESSTRSLKGEIPGHVRTTIDGTCSDCGNHAEDLQMDRLQPRFRCVRCAVKVARHEVEAVAK